MPCGSFCQFVLFRTLIAFVFEGLYIAIKYVICVLVVLFVCVYSRRFMNTETLADNPEYVIEEIQLPAIGYTAHAIPDGSIETATSKNSKRSTTSKEVTVSNVEVATCNKNKKSAACKEVTVSEVEVATSSKNKRSTNSKEVTVSNVEVATFNKSIRSATSKEVTVSKVDVATSSKNKRSTNSKEVTVSNVEVATSNKSKRSATSNKSKRSATSKEVTVSNVEVATLNKYIEKASYEDTESATSDKDIVTAICNINTGSGKSLFHNILHEGIARRNITGELINILDFVRNSKMSKVYEVNGATFVDEEALSVHDDDTPVKYELFKVDTISPDGDSEDEDLTIELDTHVQIVPQGVIVNSNVFLSDAQWNSMALVDGNLFRCAVCQLYCDRANCTDHIKAAVHLRNLDTYKPLKRFDLSIVRKIYENLHCAVCNDIFDMIDYRTHENSKAHEGNLLTAINKVCDIMYDSNIHRNVYKEESYQDTDRNNFINDRSFPMLNRIVQVPERNVQSPESNVQSPESNIQSPESNIQSPERNVQTPDREYRNNNNEFHFDANAINNDNINVYEEFSGSDDEDDEYYEDEEYTPPCQGVSYASMAKKPRMELPKFLKIDWGKKEVRVKFESWHMIIRPEVNKFYCMVCNIHDHIRFKSQHCVSCEHVEKLAMCTVVGAFEDYLIRKVDNKLYHCGHCNNLQYENQISDHIESVHPKRNKNIIDTINSPLKTKRSTKNNDNTNKSGMNKNKPEKCGDAKSESEKTDILNKSLEYRKETKTTPIIDIFGEVTLSPFGCELTISALSLNIVMERDDGYYCAVCDEVCEDVKAHVEDLSHMEMMNMTPFIRPFKSNLTRAVRGTLHCGLCNKLVMAGEILNHNMDQPHTTALANAMGMEINKRPILNTKNTYFNTPSVNLDINSVGLDKISVGQDSVSGGLAEISVDINKPISQIIKLPVSKNDVQSKNDNTNPNVLSISNHNSVNTTPLISPNQQLKDHNGVEKDGASQNGTPKKQKQNGNANKQSGQCDNEHYMTAQQSLYTGLNAGQNVYAGLPSYAGQNNHYPPQYGHMAYPVLPNPYMETSNHILGYNNLNPPNFNGPRPLFQQFPMAPNHQTIPQPHLVQDKSKTQQKITADNQMKTPSKKKQAKRNETGNTAPKSIGDTINSANDTIKSASDTIKSVNVAIDSIKGTNKSANDNPPSEKDEMVIVDNESDEEIKEFDDLEMVYLKLKSAFFKVTNLSFNTLVYSENGIRYCFVCSNTVLMSNLQKHVDSREHTENLTKNKFLDKYGVQLFRQMYLMYHCAICNLLMTRKEIKLHLDWPTHIENYNLSHKALNKKNKKLLKSGIKEYLVEMQKEAIFHSVQSKINIVSAYQIVPNMEIQKDTPETVTAKRSTSTAVRRSKMVILKNTVMKLSFDHWHGIINSKSVTKCIICQTEVKPDEVFEHVETDYHEVALGKTFDKTFYPALIRKINENTVNCIICNLELMHNDYMVHEHVNGRKHCKNQESVVNDSSNSDSYVDCYEEYLNL